MVESYALKIFENAEDSHLFLVLLNPAIPWAPLQNPSATTMGAFEAAMSTIARQANSLIPMIDANNKHLLKMEEDLHLLQELVSCEQLSIVAAKSDMSGRFWAGIGGNGKKLRQFDHHLRLLTDLEASSSQAAVRIAAVSRILRETKHGTKGIDRRCKAFLEQLVTEVQLADTVPGFSPQISNVN